MTDTATDHAAGSDDTSRPVPTVETWRAYERRKLELSERGLSPAEYERALIDVARALGI